MHGLPTIGTIGFAWFDVSGRSRSLASNRRPAGVEARFVRQAARML
jgi:hypothetical protein